MKRGIGSVLGVVCGSVLLCCTAEVALGVTNDNCADATAVGNVTNLAFNTTGATFDGPGHYITGRNIWYVYTATCTGTANIDLLGSGFDTKLAVYGGAECYPTFAALLKANDDASGPQSKVCVPVTAGNQYLIEVGGFGSAAGQGEITIACNSSGVPPANDDCQNARQVGNVTDLPFDTTCATVDGLREPCARLSHDIWYRYTATRSGAVTVSLLGSQYDTTLAIFRAGPCPRGIDNLIICNDDFGGSPQSQDTFEAISGESYLIQVGGYDLDEFGRGVLSIRSAVEPPLPTSNDDCVNARKVGDVTNLPFDTRQATFDGPGHCVTAPNLWYRYTATCTGQVIISLCGSEYDTALAVYRGAQCYPKASDLMGCNDDACGRQSELRLNVVAGNTYLIEVGGFGTDTGRGVLTISCEGEPSPPPSGDLGDAPDSSNNLGRVMTAYTHQGLLQVIVNGYYPTVFDDGSGVGPIGPAHKQPEAVAFLGERVTLEDEADIGPDEDGNNNLRPLVDSADDDKQDDGIIFPINMPQCGWARFDYIVQVVQPGRDLWVNVWCDWNRDGDWDDTLTCSGGAVPEWAVQNQLLFNLPVGSHRITTPAILASHPKNGPEQMWMRITLSEKPWKGGSHPGLRGNAGSGPLSKYDIGETEDYYFAPTMSRPICEDFNGDGVVNTQDLVDLTATWLAACPQ